eukprot:XP_004911056.1 PREDICTED: zinc finger protein 414 isoform X2 [Xenopus tropicalis]
MNREESQGAEAQRTDVVSCAKQASRGGRTAIKRERDGGRKRLLQTGRRGHRCSSYGCNRLFFNMQDLISHVSVHYKPTESLADKRFSCSMPGCTEELASMQDLMNHLKVHYKPNRYFKCENCMQHFRTHRSLFKHLHVCSNPAAQAIQNPQPQSSSTDSKPETQPQPTQNQTSVIQCVKNEAPIPASDVPSTSSLIPSTSSLSEDLHQSMSTLVSQTSSPFPLLDPSMFAGRISSPSSSSVAGSYLPYLHPSAYALSQVSRLRPLLGNQGLPVSNAVWKKNQGHSTNSRILWEHTRDSYNCMQCTFSTASRDQMTKHIEELHKTTLSSKLQDEIDYDLDLLPFHSKLPPEMEPSLLPQL